MVHDKTLALSIELILQPARGRVSFHTSLIRAGQDLVSLVDSDAAPPRLPSLEVRAPGLWTDVGIQTPLEHVTVDLEAFAVALDDPEDVFRGAFGHRTALGFELEWETADDLRAGPTPTSYELPCIVHGELLVDTETIEIDGWGWRSHRWGAPVAGDRARLRGRDAAGGWVLDQDTDRELSMQVIGAAPVPDSSHSAEAKLLQHFAHDGEGGLAWIRRTEINN